MFVASSAGPGSVSDLHNIMGTQHKLNVILYKSVQITTEESRLAWVGLYDCTGFVGTCI